MKAGFLIRCDDAGAAFLQYGELPRGAEDLLTTAGDEHVQAVFLGRLYYRDDLCRGLKPENRPEPTASAADFVLAVYREAGVGGLERLEGDYAFALWDGRSRRLLAARDPFGGFPLFYAHVGGAVVLATGMRPLLDLLPQRTVSREYLAEFLMLPGRGVQELHQEHCAYEGIHRVLAGQRIEVTTNGAVSATTWWDWAKRAEPPTTLVESELAERFRALLEEAIRQRRVGRTAAHLSGGMDSTAIALLAAQQAHRGGDEPVHGLSLVYDQFELLARETPYVDCVSEAPGLTAHRLRGEDFLDFDEFRSDTSPDEPVLALWQSATSRALIERAASLGAHTLMTGFGADQLTAAMPYHLYELLRRGRCLKAWRESARWAQVRNASRWRYLGRFGLLNFVPAGLRSGLRCWWRGGRLPWEQQHESSIGPWIRPEFAERFRLWDRAVERTRRAASRCRPLALSMAVEAIELSVGDATRWELGVPHGLMTVHPFYDTRLVRFCLGLQGRLWPDPERQKPLLADAMQEVLPPAIRERRRKGHTTEVFFKGLSRNLPVLESLVRDAAIDDLGVFDKGEMLRCLHMAGLGIGENAQGLDRLGLSLAMLKWLSTQAASFKIPGPTVRPIAVF